jgi:hypothetical protein
MSTTTTATKSVITSTTTAFTSLTA